MKTNALIIFVRNSELGKVKTRLAKKIGDENALQVYFDLLKHTREQTLTLECDKYVFYDSEVVFNDIWENTIYQKELQSEGNLGIKMQNAFELLFNKGYQNCIIIGSDLFDLKTTIIENAFQKLNTNDVVIGPAKDGGYYLLGLKKMNVTLFQNKKWGTNTVLKDSLINLIDDKLFLLEILNDIDTYDDLMKSDYYSIQKNNNGKLF